MAYSDYGGFVYQNGKRRRDKEDVEVFGLEVYESFSRECSWLGCYHGVLGDGEIRVACFKQGFPNIVIWNKNRKKPRLVDVLKEFSGAVPRECIIKSKGKKCIGWEYPEIKIEFKGHKMKFKSKSYSDSGHYEAEMLEHNGTNWKCIYDYGYGAGLTNCKK